MKVHGGAMILHGGLMGASWGPHEGLMRSDRGLHGGLMRFSWGLMATLGASWGPQEAHKTDFSVKVVRNYWF